MRNRHAALRERCDALARHSELPGGLTRVFLSAEARAATDKVLGWMREAGMQASLDAIGNAAGRYEGARPGLPCLMLGSHLDTVRDAGKWDGPLGVIGLTIITLGIYFVFWWYFLNREMADLGKTRGVPELGVYFVKPVSMAAWAAMIAVPRLR